MLNRTDNSPSIITAVIAAFGGFLMGFDASVIAGTIRFIEPDFGLSTIQTGWVVSILTLSAAFAMLVTGPVCQLWGRLPVMRVTALLFIISALLCSHAVDYWSLLLGRCVGGLAVGAILIAGPMYLAEIAPLTKRGRWVSLNQVNIVLGITAAFFSNYLILTCAERLTDIQQFLHLSHLWRMMFLVEVVPAVILLIALWFIPESPEWQAYNNAQRQRPVPLKKATSLVGSMAPRAFPNVVIVAIILAIAQQITGINAVMFYAPMIFEQSGIGTHAAFAQALLIGVTNLAFTFLAMVLVDKVGRRPLILAGMAGIGLCLLLIGYGFYLTEFRLSSESVLALTRQWPDANLASLRDVVFESDLAFRHAIVAKIGETAFAEHRAELFAAAAQPPSTLILLALLGFVACFAFSVGPVMWLILSELFPTSSRAVALACLGLINSLTSFLVQLWFPWQLNHWGNAATFTVFAAFAFISGLLLWRNLPETRGTALS